MVNNNKRSRWEGAVWLLFAYLKLHICSSEKKIFLVKYSCGNIILQ